jgi:ribonuclease HII
MEAIYNRYANNDNIAIGIGVVPPDVIDEIGIDKAQAKAQGDAIRLTFGRLAYRPFVVVDGINSPAIDAKDVDRIMLLPKADALIPAVSLASIFAKITQLRFMAEYEAKFPGYGFAKHAGYGTKDHQAALIKLGPCSVHRHSFSPVKKAIAGKDVKADPHRQFLIDILAELDDE